MSGLPQFVTRRQWPKVKLSIERHFSVALFRFAFCYPKYLRPVVYQDRAA